MATEAESLETLRDSIIAQMTAAAAANATGMDMGEAGRSVGFASSQKALQDRLDWINQRLAQLSGPFAISSTGVT